MPTGLSEPERRQPSKSFGFSPGARSFGEAEKTDPQVGPAGDWVEEHLFEFIFQLGRGGFLFKDLVGSQVTATAAAGLQGETEAQMLLWP